MAEFQELMDEDDDEKSISEQTQEFSIESSSDDEELRRRCLSPLTVLTSYEQTSVVKRKKLWTKETNFFKNFFVFLIPS